MIDLIELILALLCLFGVHYDRCTTAAIQHMTDFAYIKTNGNIICKISEKMFLCQSSTDASLSEIANSKLAHNETSHLSKGINQRLFERTISFGFFQLFWSEVKALVISLLERYEGTFTHYRNSKNGSMRYFLFSDFIICEEIIHNLFSLGDVQVQDMKKETNVLIFPWLWQKTVCILNYFVWCV